MRKIKRIMALVCALGLFGVGAACEKESGGGSESTKQNNQYVQSLTEEKNKENLSKAFEDTQTVKVALDITLQGRRISQTEAMTATAKADIVLSKTEELFNAQANLSLEGVDSWSAEYEGVASLPSELEMYFIDGFSYVKKTAETGTYYEKSAEKVLDTIAYKMGLTATDGVLSHILGAIETELEKYEISFGPNFEISLDEELTPIVGKSDNNFSLTYDMQDSISKQLEEICALPGTKTLEEVLNATLKEVDESLNCKDILDFACGLGDKKVPVAKAELDEFLGEYFHTDFVTMFKSLQKNEDLIDVLNNTLGEEKTERLKTLDIEKQFLELYKDNTVNQVVKAFSGLKYTAKEYIDSRVRPVLQTKVADSQFKTLQTELKKYTVTEFLYRQTTTYKEKSLAGLKLEYSFGAHVMEWGSVSGDICMEIKEWSKDTLAIRLPENSVVENAKV